jgi:hypothetical protein
MGAGSLLTSQGTPWIFFTTKNTKNTKGRKTLAATERKEYKGLGPQNTRNTRNVFTEANEGNEDGLTFHASRTTFHASSSASFCVFCGQHRLQPRNTCLPIDRQA